MYGDCLQVMAPAAGNGGSAAATAALPESPDAYFASSVLNPSGFGFMQATSSFMAPFSSVVPKEEEVMCLLRDEEDSGGGSGGDEREEKQPGSSTEEPELQPPAAKKKRYHRHTAHQIQQMEA